MYDRGRQFKYFYGVLQELYKIVEINYGINTEQYPLIAHKIDQHLNYYNKKNNSIQSEYGIILKGIYEDSIYTYFLIEKSPNRGNKKIFQAEIPFVSLFRDKIFGDILNSLDDGMDSYVCNEIN